MAVRERQSTGEGILKKTPSLRVQARASFERLGSSLELLQDVDLLVNWIPVDLGSEGLRYKTQRNHRGAVE